MCTLQQHRFHCESFFFRAKTESKSHMKATVYYVFDGMEGQKSHVPHRFWSAGIYRLISFSKARSLKPSTFLSSSKHSLSGCSISVLPTAPCSEPLHSAPHSHLRSMHKAPGVGEGGPLQDREDAHKCLGSSLGFKESTCFTDGGLVYKWLASKSSESLTQVPNRSQDCQGCFFYTGWFVERR